MLTSGERTLRARTAAYAKHALHDPTVAAVSGQAGLLERFRLQVIERDPSLSEVEIERRVECRRKQHMTALSLKAVKARRLQREQQQVER
jgi:hypothetical protein